MNSKQSMAPRKIIAAILVGSTSLVISLLSAEAVIRLKNRSQDNYDIEMWRYAKLLKQRSPNAILSHEHKPSSRATLQSVHIRTNELGMRGGPIKTDTPSRRRILFLGSSVTLGWGVSEEATTPQRIQAMFDERREDVEVLNAGIGNYNAERYVELFFSRFKQLTPTDIVVHFFLRDGEKLESGTDNWLLKNSELVAMIWTAIQQNLSRLSGKSDLFNHYKRAYEPNAEGFVRTKAALERLANYSHSTGTRIYLAVVPEIRTLTDYRFGFVHEAMKAVAKQYGYEFIDLYPSLAGLPASEVYVIPSDPHPNAHGHKKMAEALFLNLAHTEKSTIARNRVH